jgi:2-alkenal reductase
MRRIKGFALLILLVVLGITACARNDTAGDAGAVVATIDSSEIIGIVREEVRTELAQQSEPVPVVPTVDTDAIVETVLSHLESEMAQEGEQVPAVPTIDTETIVETVLAEVESKQEELITNVNNAAVALASESLQESLIQVYQQANPSVVYIIVPPLGSGSGFVFDEDGYVVTNNHVVDGGRSFEIVFAGGERQAAELIGTDVDSDLAVLKVSSLPEGVVTLSLADPQGIRVGEFVVAIGNPFGEQGSMSLGIISALGRSLESQRVLGTGSSYSLPEVIQTDAPINPGNSGGPLLNLDGEVIGVNSAIATTTGTNSGVGFSIPVQAVQRIVPSLIEDGAYVYPYMGAGFDSEISLDEQSVYGLPQTQGAYVLNVTPGSPADAAGLTAANENTGRGGDLIIAIDEQTIGDFSDLNSYLVFHTTVGQTIEITALRNGEPVTLSLTLSGRP